MKATIILNDMERSELAAYGFRSWITQNCEATYEVVLNLFNYKAEFFNKLCDKKNPNCHVVIKTYDPPKFFNISAANNLGLFVAQGDYVLFANSDIIYPSFFLNTFVDELQKRSLFYATAARVDLNKQQMQGIKPIEKYVLNETFDFLRGLENQPGSQCSQVRSPWTAKREIALIIGGFDSKILCHEDSEFNDRIMHYLRRTNQQNCLFNAADLYGYHLLHPASNLYNLSLEAKSILEPRRIRLLSNYESSEDIVRTDFSSIGPLLDDLYKTPGPNSHSFYKVTGIKQTTRAKKSFSILQRIASRIIRASKVLIKGV